MMKRNEKGSIILVMILVLLLSSIVTILTLLFISEKINFERSTNKVLQNVYEEDKKYEITKNILKQYLDQIAYDDVEDLIWSNEESDEFEILLESNILPKLIGDYEVSVENLNDDYVSNYCEELISVIDDTEEFIGYDCSKEEIEIEYRIIFFDDKNDSIFEFNVRGIEMELNSDGSTLKLNLDNVNIETVNME
jgi:hypothetical protein